MSNELVVTSITNAVSVQVKGLVSEGSLHLPPNYSADNALKAAMLMLPEVKGANKLPVLKSCTQDSIKATLLSMCIQGLNPDKKQCSFIAYGERLTLQRSYFGDITVAKQVDSNIEDIYAAAVFEKDEFSYTIKRGSVVDIEHKQKLENKNGKIKAAYATVIYRDGREISTVMTIEQIHQAWKQSPAKPFDDNGNLKPTSTHAQFPEEMTKKTVVHRACKPIIDSSDDSNLVVQFAKRTRDESDEAEVEAEVNENANRETIDVEYEDVPVDPGTGEVLEPSEGKEPF